MRAVCTKRKHTFIFPSLNSLQAALQTMNIKSDVFDRVHFNAVQGGEIRLDLLAVLRHNSQGRRIGDLD